MLQLTISEIARQAGMRASAIRYYEQIGILPEAVRKSGQRRYDASVLLRLAIIQRARQVGFRLEEIKQLFFGYARDTSPATRWIEMSDRKLVELEAQAEQIRTMQSILYRLQNCDCTGLDECGQKMLLQRNINGTPKKNEARRVTNRSFGYYK
jgi:MerR family redox-sensitive transcriptional activator SoxR